jgi:hypothetical protein
VRTALPPGAKASEGAEDEEKERAVPERRRVCTSSPTNASPFTNPTTGMAATFATRRQSASATFHSFTAPLQLPEANRRVKGTTANEEIHCTEEEGRDEVEGAL